jgi:DNA polymerase I-like protein with 3'-5' exonuclease and polymerase domains
VEALLLGLPAPSEDIGTVLRIPATPALLAALVRAMTERIDLTWTFHGAQPQLHGLANLGLRPARVACTKTAATLLSEGREHDPQFADCAARVLHLALTEPPLLARASVDGDAAEATLLPTLLARMTPMLEKRDLARVFALESELLPAVVDMERAGFAVDTAAFERIAAAWRAERAVATEPERIARLDKLLGTYAHWPRHVEVDGRIRCRLHPMAADSGRFSCTDPNLQQVPSSRTAPGLRGCFRAEDGARLVIADYAQIELRVAAHLAPCDAMRRVFREGRDPHRTTAATITGKREVDVTEHERKLAKAVNFGFLFGMGARRFQEYARDGYGIELDDRDARAAREAFLATFPGIAAWHDRVSALQRRSEREDIVVRSALGRRKRFAAGKFSFTAALNIPVQGTAADGFKLAMVELHRRLPHVGGRGILCVHDEYIAEVPEARAEEAQEIVRSAMVHGMARLLDSVPVVVETRVARTWG